MGVQAVPGDETWGITHMTHAAESRQSQEIRRIGPCGIIKTGGGADG